MYINNTIDTNEDINDCTDKYDISKLVEDTKFYKYIVSEELLDDTFVEPTMVIEP